MSPDLPVTPEQMAALPPEFRALLQAVIDFYEARVARLESELAAVRAELEATRKTPRNSSLPPSSEHPHAKPAPPKSKSGKQPGGQPGHTKYERALLPLSGKRPVRPVLMGLLAWSRRIHDLRRQDHGSTRSAAG